MNNRTANTSSAVKPAPGRVSRVPGRQLELALRPAPAPIVTVIRAANALRDLKDIGRAGIRFIAAKDAPHSDLKRSAAHSRQWELTQRVYAFQGRKVA
jgi:hypothetical protein